MQCRLTLLGALLASLLCAQRHKPIIDPESPQGLLIQQIQQERNAAERVRLLEQFDTQYPRHESAPWVWEQLLPAYLNLKDYDRALAVGEKLLAAGPDDLDTAQRCLHAAEAKNDPELIARYAIQTWDLASRLAAPGKANASDPRAAEATQVMNYSEYALVAAATQTQDSRRRLELFQTLEQKNPKSQYMEGAYVEMVRTYKQMGNSAKAASLAEQVLATSPDNEDLLLLVAEHYFKKDDQPNKVITYSSRVISVLENKSCPQGVSQDEWLKKKAQYLGAGYFMAGIVHGQREHYALADRLLRDALPYAKENNQMLAAALYTLGVANYKLAEQSPDDRVRIHDALKFVEDCAALKTSYQERAQKYVDSIKAEYNLR